MSFILDALKKSETERQQQGATEFSSVPTSPGEGSPARWLWLLAALLAVNFAVLIGILLKPDKSVEAPAASSVQPLVASEPAPATDNSFERQVANRIEQQPVRTPPPAATASAPATSEAAPPQPVVAPPSTTRNLPTMDQLRLDGSLQMTDLHLDIHVFSEVPAERFVFINMNKYREGERTAAGPAVDEITPDGVVLDYQGRRFLLPRQ